MCSVVVPEMRIVESTLRRPDVDAVSGEKDKELIRVLQEENAQRLEEEHKIREELELTKEELALTQEELKAVEFDAKEITKEWTKSARIIVKR